jgi:hypothetical protein
MSQKKIVNIVVLYNKIVEILRLFLSASVFLYYARDDLFDVPLILYSLFTASFLYICLGIFISFVDFFILKFPKKILREENFLLTGASLKSHEIAKFIKIRFFCRISSILLSFVVSAFCDDLFSDASFILTYLISRSITDFFLKKQSIPMLNYKIIKSNPLYDIKKVAYGYQNSFADHGLAISNIEDPRNPSSPNYVFKNHWKF